MAPKQISDRVAQRARVSMTRDRLRRALVGEVERDELSEQERAGVRLVREELQADTDMDLDPAYKDALAALTERLGRRRVYETVFHPERVLTSEVTYPLTNDEAATVLGTLLEDQSVRVPEAWTLERMVEDKLLPEAIQVGGGSLPRNAYFARHIVAAAYRTLFVTARPEVIKAEVTIARGELEHETATYLRMLPDVDVRIVEMAEQVAEGD